jgi:asparagine synthase (glutamine-hydrolysing)
VSELFKTEHQEFLIEPDMAKLLPKIAWYTDEPMADPALIPLLLLSEKAKKTSTVVLTGDGGDELFAGYDQHRILKLANAGMKIPFAQSIGPAAMRIIPLGAWDKVQKHATLMGKSAYSKGEQTLREIRRNKAKAYYELTGMFNDEERKSLLKAEYHEKNDYAGLNKEYFTGHTDYLKQLLYFDFKRLLPESFMMKTDRMTMARSIEARVPLLDHRIVELAFSMPSKYKLHGINGTKYVFKKAMSRYLPKDIIWRKKQTFHVPIENWLDKDLKSSVSDWLNITHIYKQGILDPYHVKKIMEHYNEGKLYYARQLWTLLNFQLWHKAFIEKEKIM